MATSLMTHPCDEACDQEGEFKISFTVTSLEMTDKEMDQQFTDVLIALAWDGNVIKIMNTRPDAEEFNEEKEITLHAKPTHISQKLKLSPIMLDLSRGCTELGTLKMPISACFADALLCSSFNSQTFTNEFRFVKDNQQNAIMNANFHIQKLSDNGIFGNLHKELKSKLDLNAKKMRRIEATAKGEDIFSDENDPCDDFACPDEQAEHCKRDLGLDQNVYRIINGILINAKDKTGPCGAKCPVAAKYIKNLCKDSPIAPLSTRFKFNEGASKCGQLFDKYCHCEGQITSREVSCPKCVGLLKLKPTKTTSSCSKNLTRKPCNDDWIDRNIREEDLLKNLCEKYGINVDNVRGVGQQVDLSSCKKGKKKRKNVRCPKKSKEISLPSMITSECIEKKPERERFIKRMRRKSHGVYSYDYGNDYPLRRTCSNIENGAGDCFVPKYMGWRWDEPIPGIGDKKWYPGHINKTVRCLMKHCLNPFPYDTIPLTRRDKNGRVIKTSDDYSKYPEFNPDLVQKPTLLVQKRDDTYCITMNPLKDKKKLETDCNPYLNCSPLKFNIKMDPEEIKKHRAKKLLREHGLSKKCSCKELKCCRCMSENAKKLLSYEMKNISKMMKLQQPLRFAELNDSSDSELEMEFVTPSALIDRRKCKPDVVHCETQYRIQDFLKTKKVEEKPKPMKKSKPIAPKTIPKPKRQIESLYLDPPCQPAVTCVPQLEPKCVTIHPIAVTCEPQCQPKCVSFQRPFCC